MRLGSRWTAIAVAAVSAVVIAGCGSSRPFEVVIDGSVSSSTPSTTKSVTPAQPAGKPVMGGTLTVLDTAGSIDNLDPGYWYYQTDYEELMQTTTRQLYTFTAQGTTPRAGPGDGAAGRLGRWKTLTIQLQPGYPVQPTAAEPDGHLV